MASLSVAEALEQILAQAAPLQAENVPLADAHGRVLAADIKSLRTQPPGDVSAMDGYAVRASDVANAPADLRIVGEISAGHPLGAKLQCGEAMRIFTGGLLPDGADAVVVQENTQRDNDRVRVLTASSAGKHIRRAGVDFRDGDILLRKGRRLNGRDLTLAAAMNHSSLPIHRTPRIAIFVTGDELVPPGSVVGAGQIVSSNAYQLIALAQSEGASVTDLGIVRDRMDETVAAIRAVRESAADILVTTGGASVGDHDLVQKAFAAEGMALSFWKVAMRPGRPVLHGRIGSMQVLGLPGNPVSAFVGAFLFLVPLIRKLSGRSDLTHVVETAKLATPLPLNDERQDYLRARLSDAEDGSLLATPFSVQDSSMTGRLADSDAVIVRAPHDPAIAAGGRVSIVKLPL